MPENGGRMLLKGLSMGPLISLTNLAAGWYEPGATQLRIALARMIMINIQVIVLMDSAMARTNIPGKVTGNPDNDSSKNVLIMAIAIIKTMDERSIPNKPGINRLRKDSGNAVSLITI